MLIPFNKSLISLESIFYILTNLNKCCFYQDEVQFFDYVISLQGIYMKNMKIEAIYD